MDNTALITPDAKTWAEFVWPDWVPANVKEQIEGFWFPEWGRGPQTWLKDAEEQGAPEFGSVVSLPTLTGYLSPLATGRFVHAWNNIGRLVLEDGTFAYVSFHRGFDPADYIEMQANALRAKREALANQMAELEAQEAQFKVSSAAAKEEKHG